MCFSIRREKMYVNTQYRWHHVRFLSRDLFILSVRVSSFSSYFFVLSVLRYYPFHVVNFYVISINCFTITPYWKVIIGNLPFLAKYCNVISKIFQWKITSSYMSILNNFKLRFTKITYVFHSSRKVTIVPKLCHSYLQFKLDFTNFLKILSWPTLSTIKSLPSYWTCYEYILTFWHSSGINLKWLPSSFPFFPSLLPVPSLVALTQKSVIRFFYCMFMYPLPISKDLHEYWNI
jgi:hypothetical protein